MNRRTGQRAVVLTCALVTAAAVAGTAALLSGGKDEPRLRPPATGAPSAAAASPDVRPSVTAKDAAADEARARYLEFVRVQDDVAQGGYADIHRYRAVAVDPELSQLQVDARGFAAESKRQVGSVKVASLTVRSVQLDVDAARTYPSVTLAVCLDVSGTDAVDANGKSVVAPGRATRIRSEAVLQRIPPGALEGGPEGGGWFVAEVTQPGDQC